MVRNSKYIVEWEGKAANRNNVFFTHFYVKNNLYKIILYTVYSEYIHIYIQMQKSNKRIY